METNIYTNLDVRHHYKTIKNCIKYYKEELDPQSSITEYLLRQLIKNKKVKAISMGGKYHVDFDDFLNYLSSYEREVA